MLDRRLPEPAAGPTHAAALPGLWAAWRRGEIVLKWGAVALGCSIPVSVAVDNILLYVLLFFWLAYQHIPQVHALLDQLPAFWQKRQISFVV